MEKAIHELKEDFGIDRIAASVFGADAAHVPARDMTPAEGCRWAALRRVTEGSRGHDGMPAGSTGCGGALGGLPRVARAERLVALALHCRLASVRTLQARRMSMKALTPWTGMSSLKKELDRLFDRVWEGDFPDWPSFGEWSPKLDVTDTKDALVVKAEVPGIDPKEIEVTLQEQVLSIKGEKKEEKEEKDERRYRAERSYGAFARAIRLPVPVEAGKVTAAFKNGVLTVTLPKGAAAMGATIPIKAE
jgi:HSP20 family protein